MALSVEGLAAGYGGAPVVEDLSFALEPGEAVALVGPSGAGKSTVLRTLAYLMDPIAGHLRLDGQPPEAIGVPRWRRRVHRLAQRAQFFGGTVAEELARPFSYRSAERPFDEAAAQELLDRLGLGDRMDDEVATLSEGERQRVALVRSLGLRPAVLMLDEPTSALDEDSAHAVEALILGQRERSELALVLVSHSPAQRERLGARELRLKRSRPR